MRKHFPAAAVAGVLVVLVAAVCAADAPASNPRMDPSQLIYTFFPVTMLQAFVGISDDQAAKISAIEKKWDSDRAAAKDDTEKRKLRRKASDDVKAVLLPGQVDTLAGCALEIQILANTFGHDRVARLTLTSSQMPRVRVIMADAVAKYTQANQERDQEINALPPQTSQEAEQKRIAQILQEREQKIRAMRAVVRDGMEALFTDQQKAELAAKTKEGQR